MKILLITPPLLQPNTPYAATPILSAWLRSVGHDTIQADLSLDLLLRLFSAEGIATLAEELELPEDAEEAYRDRVDEVVGFLQGKKPHAATPLAERGYLPEGPHLSNAYEQEEQLGWNFRGLDVHDRAAHLASLFLDDIAEAAKALDPNFGFSRYAEKLAASLPSFEPLQRTLNDAPSIFVQWLEEMVEQYVEQHAPDMVILTVPFPGCLVGALIIARHIKRIRPDIHISMGGGYVNTELRELRDPAIFDYVDTITLDSGFLPLQRLADRVEPSKRVRTFVRENETVKYYDCTAGEVVHNDLPPPDFTGLKLDHYFGMFEVLNPVTRLWSDGRWNKLVLAHGCCWSRCAFCDTSIDYIGRYDPADPKTICDWIEALISQTGFNGFHFVDEALPPSLLDGLCDEILSRGLQIEWWGNIRFEKKFTVNLIRKMAGAGCIAVTGGLETCNDRTLKLMRKGITTEHAARVLSDLADAGIMTHAYLMYGFPTQTLDETLEALDTVRALFEAGALHSAYWHRFALTAHSDMAIHPERYAISVEPPSGSDFAINEIPFNGTYDYEIEPIGLALKTATYNYQLGIGLDIPVVKWMEPNPAD
jgi:hypothetical protein